jgi:hypothetical protein
MGILRGASVAATIMVAAVLLVSGCAGAGTESAPEPTASSTPTKPPSVADLVTPSPTPTPLATEEPLAQTLDAGVVADGTSATVSGNGPSNVAYQRQGELAVVIDLDCSACTGTAKVTAPGRMSPFGEATAPLRGSFLMDVFTADPVNQLFIVQAEGPWTVTLSSWNDLPLVSGPQVGTGPTVLYLSDDVSHVTVDYTPVGVDDSFSGRVFTTSDNTQVFGDTVAFSEVFEADLPGVMAIQTNGSWTVTPTP